MAVATAVAEADAILAVRALHRHFAGLQALDGVDLSVRPGELLAIIGPNGAGKSTVFNLISGLLPPDRGRILFDGADVTATKPHHRAHLGIGRTFQLTQPFHDMTVFENVMVGNSSGILFRSR